MAAHPLPQRSGADMLWAMLPIAVVGGLAAWSFWLLSASQGSARADAARPAAAEPELVLTDFVARTYEPGGRLRSTVTGTRALREPADGSMWVDDAQVTAFQRTPSKPSVVNANANRMWVNDQQTQYRLMGQARVEKVPQDASNKADKLLFLGEQLLIDDDLARVSSDQPVTLYKGQQRLSGERMQYDQSSGVLQLEGRVVWRQPHGEPEPL